MIRMTLYTNDSMDSALAELVLKIKGVEYQSESSLQETEAMEHGPILSHRSGVYQGIDVILPYLDERYPHPQLYGEDPDVRAAVRMALRQILAGLFTTTPNLETLTELEDSLPPTGFIRGISPSILDLAVVPVADALPSRKELGRFAARVRDFVPQTAPLWDAEPAANDAVPA